MIEIRRVTGPDDIVRVAGLAREIWSQRYVPIIGQSFLMDDYRMAKTINTPTTRKPDQKEISRRKLAITAATRFIAAMAALACLFFLPAGTFAYWEAWAFLAILFSAMAFMLGYLFKNDPELLERRLITREKETKQKLFIPLLTLCFLAVFLLPGFDRRWGWSALPVRLVITADIFILLGFGLFFLTLKENRYASRIIEVVPGQKLISTGPYGIIRHPMYLAMLVIYVFSPLALGSYWGMVPLALMIPLLALRLLNEESVLIRNLKGYKEYMRATRHRLVPGVW